MNFYGSRGPEAPLLGNPRTCDCVVYPHRRASKGGRIVEPTFLYAWLGYRNMSRQVWPQDSRRFIGVDPQREFRGFWSSQHA